MRKYLQSLLLALALVATPSAAFAQNFPNRTISTSGADCSTATACAVYGVSGIPSVGIYVDVGVSGTFIFEATINNITWFAISDDVAASGSATADGAFFFSNPGYAYIRLRASAISGAATVYAFKGFSGLKSTATLSGSAQGDGAVQDGANSAIEATVADLTNSNPLATMLVDANGTQITSFATGSATGSAVPSTASYLGLNVGGTLRGATASSVGSAFAQHMAIVDGSGNQITSFGGGTQYTNGSAQATPTGTTALGFDGANVRALATDASGNLQVEFPSAQAVTGSGTFTVANGGTFAVQAAQSGTWNIGSLTTFPDNEPFNIAQMNGVAVTMGNGASGTGVQRVTIASDSTGVIGATQSGTWTVQPGNTANTTPWLTSISQGGNTAAVNASGQLSITCANCSGSGASSVDNSAWTFGTTSGAGAMFVVDDTGTNAVTENSIGAARMSTSRVPYSVLSNTAGTSFGTIRDTGSNDSLNVAITDASGNQVTPAVDYTDGTAWSAGQTGPLGMFVRKDSAGAFTGVADGDFTPGQTNATGSLRVAEDSAASALTALQLIDDDQTGATPSAVASAASTNSTNVKASAGRLMGIYLVNTTATLYYIRFYNLASAPTCSSATGFLFTMPIPASTTGAGFSMPFPPSGLAFGTGIGYCITGGASSTDNTNAATGIYGVLSYK
jgi:hypothetical protein